MAGVFGRILAVLVCALLLTRAPARAGPPYQVDDPVPTSYRSFEIYLNSQYTRDLGEADGATPALEINYGLMPNVQFSVTTQISASRGASAPWTFGAGDSEVGLKVRFAQETSRWPQIAFYPSIVIPTGNVAEHLGEGSPSVFLPLWAQKTFGRWSVFGGGGYLHNAGATYRDSTFSGIAAQCEASDKFSFGAEVFHRTADIVGGQGSTGFSVGSVRRFDASHAILLSVGRSLHGTNALSVYGAFELDLGPRPTRGAPVESAAGP
jgi:hypothetical protein